MSDAPLQATLVGNSGPGSGDPTPSKAYQDVAQRILNESVQGIQEMMGDELAEPEEQEANTASHIASIRLNTSQVLSLALRAQGVRGWLGVQREECAAMGVKAGHPDMR